MKHIHTVLLAATYRPFQVAPDLEDSLPELLPPRNIKDELKKAEHVREAQEKRKETLADLWPLKQFDSLQACYFSPDESNPLVVLMEKIDDTTNVLAELKPIREKIVQANDNGEIVRFIGINVRDILRILCTICGDENGGLLPYQGIADQRNVIDPLGMFDAQLKKDLDVRYVLTKIGIESAKDYSPGVSVEKDCRLAIQVYNRLCREGSQPKLAI